MKNIFSREKLNIATGLVKPKTTALFFDKLWLPESDIIVYDNDIPKEILYQPKLQKNRKFLFAVMQNRGDRLSDFDINVLRNYDCAIKLNSGIDPMRNGEGNGWSRGGQEKEKKLNYKDIRFQTSYYRNRGIHDFVYDMKRRYNIDITPIYIDKTQFEKDCSSPIDQNKSDFRPIIVAMKNIPSVVEDGLEWKQILDFRKDKKSVKKLQNFRKWVNTELVIYKEEQINDIYEKALDDYKAAIKKHGITTVAGSISIVLGVSAAILSAVTANEMMAKLVAGLNMAESLSVFMPKLYYAYEERANNPIAYIYDILKLEEKK